MTEKEYISFLLLFLLCLLGTAFKLWDYIRVRRAVKEERARVGTIPGQVVIKVDWRASLSTFCLMLGVLAPLVTGSITKTLPLVIFILFALAALSVFGAVSLFGGYINGVLRLERRTKSKTFAWISALIYWLIAGRIFFG